VDLRLASYYKMKNRFLIITPKKFHIIFTNVAIFFTMLIYVYSRDAMIVTTLDTLTSLLAGCTIFSILGNLIHELGEGVDIKEVVTGGPGLAFVSYPEAISKFDEVPQVSDILCIRVGLKSYLFIYFWFIQTDTLSTRNTCH
jgi:Na+-dependent transporters of the SNF family